MIRRLLLHNLRSKLIFNLINCNSRFPFECRVSRPPIYLTWGLQHVMLALKFTHFSAKASLSWRSWQFHRKLDFALDHRRHSEAPGGATRGRGRALVRCLAVLSIRSRLAKFHNHCSGGPRRPLGSRAIVESASSIKWNMRNSENFRMPFANNFPNVRKHLEGLKHFPLWTFQRFFISKHQISILTIAKNASTNAADFSDRNFD